MWMQEDSPALVGKQPINDISFHPHADCTVRYCCTTCYLHRQFKDASLFDELKLLLQERVVSATSNGDRDAEAPKSRKRARKEEVCVQGERLQFTYRYRKTLPRYHTSTAVKRMHG